MIRIIIFALILGGLGYFIFGDKEAERSSGTEVTQEETQTDGEASEEGGAEEATVKLDFKGTPEELKVETPTKTLTKTPEPKASQPLNNTVSFTSSQNTQSVIPTRETRVKVYLYEWNVDIQNMEIPTGNIAFEVYNNGRFTHNFTVAGVQDYGKVLPGETKTFTARLGVGSFEIISNRDKDLERDMREGFSVVR